MVAKILFDQDAKEEEHLCDTSGDGEDVWLRSCCFSVIAVFFVLSKPETWVRMNVCRNGLESFLLGSALME